MKMTEGILQVKRGDFRYEIKVKYILSTKL